MKLFILALFAASALAAPKFSDPRLDASRAIPVQERPGFWEGRAFPEAFWKTNLKERRIVGGSEAVPNSIPWQVALIIVFPDGTGLCGGSVLGSNAVLTAAHCIGGESIMPVGGAHDYWAWEETQQYQSVLPENFRSHPNYNPQTLTNDVAIIFLNTPWEHNAFVQPTRLPNAFANELFVGETATVSGWGRTTNSGSTSDVLRVATVPVITNSQCASVFGSIIVSSTLCVSTTHGQGSCQGDSGGPLTVPRAGDSRPIQIGIVSFGASGSCVGTYPSGFARVTSFLNWILGNH